MNDVTKKFASLVKEFCNWAESDGNTEIQEAKTAIHFLANLYSLALSLPKDTVGKDLETNRVSHEDWMLIYKRFGALSFNYYSSFDNPAKIEEESNLADLADDLADIYRDLKAGLELYQSGHVDEALWEWNNDFNIHWGRHATGALNALHSYAENENIKL